MSRRPRPWLRRCLAALVLLLSAVVPAIVAAACPPGQIPLPGSRGCRPAGHHHHDAIAPHARPPALPADIHHGFVIGVPVAAQNLIPVRAYLRAADIPPAGIGAYGVVGLRAKATPDTRARLMMVCAAYKANLPPQSSLPHSVGLRQQMLTIWPLDDPAAPLALADDCDFALDHYDLFGGQAAIRDAERQGADLSGPGPYLLGWSPSTDRGLPDKLVLVVDMSNFDSADSFNQAFLFWQKEVVQNPKLWQYSFSAEELRLSVRDFVDTYGSDLMAIVHLP